MSDNISNQKIKKLRKFVYDNSVHHIVKFIEENPNPTDDEIREAISGNLCRCTGYQHIIDAVKIAVEKN